MKKQTLQLFLFLIIINIFNGCAGTGVLLKVPPFTDKVPEILTGFYSVHAIKNGKVSKKRGSEFIGEFVYLYKDDFFENGKYFSGIKGAFMPERYIRTSFNKSKLKYFWIEGGNKLIKHNIVFSNISENKLTAVFNKNIFEKDSVELVFYKQHLAGKKIKTIPIAHRGVCYQPPNNYDGIFPANTIPAFETALRSGYKGFELDVHVTKDNRFVVSHDENLSVSTTARGFVENKNLDQFENSLVVKSAAIPENRATATEAYIAAPIVSLKKVLNLFINDPRLYTLVVDIKPDTDKRIYEAAKHDFKNFTKQQQKKILFLTREEKSAKLLRKICPYSDIALEGSLGPEPIENLENFYPEAVGLPRAAHNAISFGANILLAFESVESAEKKIKKAQELSDTYNYKIVMWTFSKEWRLDFIRQKEFFPDWILLDIPYYKYAIQQMRYLNDKKIVLDTKSEAITKGHKNPIHKRMFNKHIKNFWFKSRTILELTFGLTNPKQRHLNNPIATTGNWELKLGRSEINVFSKTNTELNEIYLFTSVMNSKYAFGSSEINDISFDAFRFGVGKTDGFGYVGSGTSFVPYVSTALTWTKLNGYSPTIQNNSQILNRYLGNFRFGDRSLYGIKFELFSLVQLNLNYETGIIYPRCLFMKWLGSTIIAGSGYAGLSYITGKWIDDEPLWGPIVNTLIRAGYLYTYYLLREKDMNWPFPTEAPLRYEGFNFGFSLVF